MHPNSKVAEAMQLKEDNIVYLIKDSISPYLRQQFSGVLKDTMFTLHIDEANKCRSHFVIVVRYMKQDDWDVKVQSLNLPALNSTTAQSITDALLEALKENAFQNRSWFAWGPTVATLCVVGKVACWPEFRRPWSINLWMSEVAACITYITRSVPPSIASIILPWMISSQRYPHFPLPYSWQRKRGNHFVDGGWKPQRISGGSSWPCGCFLTTWCAITRAMWKPNTSKRNLTILSPFAFCSSFRTFFELLDDFERTFHSNGCHIHLLWANMNALLR